MVRPETGDLLRAERLGIRGFEGHAIDFLLSPGSRIGILGGAGSGKTCLLRTLAKLESVDYGKLFWGNVDVSRKSLRLLTKRHYISLLLANPYALFDSKIRVSHLLSDIEAKGSVPIPELLEEKNVTGAFMDQPVASLSGIMRIRLALILMQHNQSPVVLIDDIFRYIVRDVWPTILDSINGIVDGSQALVIASRSYESLRTMDYILILHEGRFIEGGPRDAVFSQPMHPITKALIHGRSDKGGKSGRNGAEIVNVSGVDEAFSVSPGHWVLASDSDLASPE
jgi:peptide/nickel transport system ATP-binding protein